MASSWNPNSQQGGPHLPFDRGFWATRPNFPPDNKGESRNGSNAFLENGRGERVYMWVNEVTANFALSGTTAQSAKRRSFYPHNLAQPSITVGGQTPNTYEYNRLSAFIRDGHLKQVAGKGDDEGVFALRVYAGGKNTTRDIQRGRRKQISVDGYIQNAAAGATRFINAPPFQFTFIITRAYKFLSLDDDPVAQFRLKQILDLLEEQKVEDKGLFIEKAEPQNVNLTSQSNLP
jgi:hypothetical protein